MYIKYVLNNVINRIFYLIKRFIKKFSSKIFLLIIMFLLGMVFQANVFAAENDIVFINPYITNNMGLVYRYNTGTFFYGASAIAIDNGTIRQIPSNSYLFPVNLSYTYTLKCTSVGTNVNYGFLPIEYVPVSTPDTPIQCPKIIEFDLPTEVNSTVDFTSPITGFLVISYENTSLSSWTLSYSSSKNDTSTILNGVQNSSSDTNNFIKDDSYNDSDVVIDSSSVSDVDDTDVNNLFTTLFTNFQNKVTGSNWGSVEVISIPVPYTDSTIDLRSDLVSSRISGTFLFTLIQCGWYSAFGIYVFKFSNKIIKAIRSGDILSGLSLDDEVISSSML